MVGPLPDEERRRGLRRVAAGFAAVVGVSAGTTAYFSGATAVEAAAIALLGLLVGVLLALFLGVR
jgi:hypothetical protein